MTGPRIGSMKVGQVVSGARRTLTLARALALSGGAFDSPGWPDRNLHTDSTVAAETGLAEIVVSGTQWEGYLVGLLVEIFGVGWFAGGELDIKIPRSVRIGDTVQPYARLDAITACEGADAHAPATLATLSVWCENGDGQQVMIGTALCAIPRADQPPH